MRQVIPRAINTLEANIRNRLLLRQYDLRTIRQKNNYLIKKIIKYESSIELPETIITENEGEMLYGKVLSEIEIEQLEFGILNKGEAKRKCKLKSRSVKRKAKVTNKSTKKIKNGIETKIESANVLELCKTVNNILKQQKKLKYL